jgi:hypothetical protein
MMIKDIKFIRERQQHLMPEIMRELAIELSTIERPDKLSLSKSEYIKAWVAIFDTDFLCNITNYEYYSAKLSRANILQLERAFEWTLTHFAELDLGCNMKWLGVTLSILKFTKKEELTTEQENQLIFVNITDTLWYDY